MNGALTDPPATLPAMTVPDLDRIALEAIDVRQRWADAPPASSHSTYSFDPPLRPLEALRRAGADDVAAAAELLRLRVAGLIDDDDRLTPAGERYLHELRATSGPTGPEPR